MTYLEYKIITKQGPLKQILIIEDDAINCMLYKEILADTFVNIDFAYDGQEGIDKFKEKYYDLVLLDLGLPKIHGLEVAKLIKEYEKKEQISIKTAIIVLTANNFPGTRKLAIDAGVDEYLTKPFDIHYLKSVVKTYLLKRDENLVSDS